MSIRRFLFGGLAAAAIGTFAGSFASPMMTAAITPPSSVPPRLRQPARTPRRIERIATDPYTRDSYPDVIHRFGKLVPTINAERRAVAEIVSRDPRCDGVENVQITDKATNTARRYMAECTNLSRFYFDQRALARRAPTAVQTIDDMARDGLRDW